MGRLKISERWATFAYVEPEKRFAVDIKRFPADILFGVGRGIVLASV
jgi:hypothetical protein